MIWLSLGPKKRELYVLISSCLYAEFNLFKVLIPDTFVIIGVFVNQV